MEAKTQQPVIIVNELSVQTNEASRAILFKLFSDNFLHTEQNCADHIKNSFRQEIQSIDFLRAEETVGAIIYVRNKPAAGDESRIHVMKLLQTPNLLESLSTEFREHWKLNDDAAINRVVAKYLCNEVIELYIAATLSRSLFKQREGQDIGDLPIIGVYANGLCPVSAFSYLRKYSEKRKKEIRVSGMLLEEIVDKYFKRVKDKLAVEPIILTYDPTRTIPSFNVSHSENSARMLMLEMHKAPYTLSSLFAVSDNSGMSLFNLLENPPQFLTSLLLQICATLHVLQVGLRFTHYDLHSSNVFLVGAPIGRTFVMFNLDNSGTSFMALPRTSRLIRIGGGGERGIIAQLADFGFAHMESSGHSLSAGYDKYEASFIPPVLRHLDQTSMAHTAAFNPSHDMWRLALDIVLNLEAPKSGIRVAHKFITGAVSPGNAMTPHYVALYSLLYNMLEHRRDFMDVFVTDHESKTHHSAVVSWLMQTSLATRVTGGYTLAAVHVSDMWAEVRAQVNMVANFGSTTLAFEYNEMLFYFASFLTHRFSGSQPIPAEDAIPLKVLQSATAKAFLMPQKDHNEQLPTAQNSIVWELIEGGPDTKTLAQIKADVYNYQ